jgi:hypothetical protein
MMMATINLYLSKHGVRNMKYRKACVITDMRVNESRNVLKKIPVSKRIDVTFWD